MFYTLIIFLLIIIILLKDIEIEELTRKNEKQNGQLKKERSTSASLQLQCECLENALKGLDEDEEGGVEIELEQGDSLSAPWDDEEVGES
mmetsp:Transcript_35715/g.31504  ORF Transcript_35715/g.31504 Transcript_35715/m.31504 type:complete len:90 (-) Transcript_35715:211-480(-)